LVNGFKIFYRVAGDPQKSALLLLHGFPTSSHMFRNLIPQLADDDHLVAPDLPGFGLSDAPDHTSGSWTQLTEQLFMGLREFSTKALFRGWSFLDSEIRTPQGGFAVGVSVDDPRRIEGWHSKLGSPVMFVVDEAKSIRDAIFQSFRRVYQSAPLSFSFHKEIGFVILSSLIPKV
jgi:pimeloyl-ACP methyl ester carboxylesterase